MAEQITVLNKNIFNIVGELVEVKSFKDDLAKNGKQYASCNYIIKSIVDGVENLFDVRIFSMAQTAGGAASKKYASILDSQKWVGKRVRTFGAIKENRLFSSKEGRVTSRQELDAGSIFLADSNAEDTATFDIEGYVYKQIEQVNNKNGEPYMYKLAIGQYDYADSKGSKHLNIVNLDLSLDPIDQPKYNYINDNYNRGDTVSLSGSLSSIVTVVERKEETAFGDPVIKTFNNTRRGYFIKSGSEPLDLENGAAYTRPLIEELEKNYAAKEVELTAAGKEGMDNGTIASAAKPATAVKSKAKLF